MRSLKNLFFVGLNTWTLDEWHFVFSHLGKAHGTEMKSNHMLDSPIVLLRYLGHVIYKYIYCDYIYYILYILVVLQYYMKYTIYVF